MKASNTANAASFGDDSLHAHVTSDRDRASLYLHALRSDAGQSRSWPRERLSALNLREIYFTKNLEHLAVHIPPGASGNKSGRDRGAVVDRRRRFLPALRRLKSRP